VLADTFEGAPLPGTPNDIVCDSKGGLYITVMSFAGSPGSNVIMYRSPEGSLRRVTEPGDFGIPNGIALSPDGGTLYVNDDRNEHVMACDVRRDGSLGKPRPFARLIIDESVLGGARAKTYADGMTVDAGGNLYVCASGFLQVFDSEGNYRGSFVLPKPAFHITFGGANLSTLYIACLNRIFTIETNMKGLAP
jgi:gluconolactonase